MLLCLKISFSSVPGKPNLPYQITINQLLRKSFTTGANCLFNQRSTPIKSSFIHFQLLSIIWSIISSSSFKFQLFYSRKPFDSSYNDLQFGLSHFNALLFQPTIACSMYHPPCNFFAQVTYLLRYSIEILSDFVLIFSLVFFIVVRWLAL